MSEMMTMKCVGKPAQFKTEPGRPSLRADYISLEASLKQAEEKYERDRADYFNTLADEPVLIKKCKRWARSAYDYMRWAGTLFNADITNNALRKRAMEIMDRITKESGVRHNNTIFHAKLMNEQAAASNDPEKITEVEEKMDKAEMESGAFYRNAILTQIRFTNLFEKGEGYVSTKQEKESAAAARVAEMREKLFPKDHIYLPGRIIPPHPVPWGERVPPYPDPYFLAKSQPVDAYEFNEEVDEIVIKKGYVSPDGLIDDQSVTYDLENGTCTMKYRGGVPVTWDFWKARGTWDAPDPESWTGEYIYRYYRQQEADAAPGILKHQQYEDEIQDYDKIPGTELRYDDIYPLSQ